MDDGLTPEQRRESLIDTWASLALDGYLPTERDKFYAREYISGRMTLDQIHEATLREFPPAPEGTNSGDAQ